MFLWVQLVLATLESVYSVTEMQRAVEGVPEGLDKVLEGFIRSVLAHANVALDMTPILTRIQSQPRAESRGKAKQGLEWIACAERPVKKFEVQDGIALHDENLALNDDTGFKECV
jgi:hypothetical protein